MLRRTVIFGLFATGASSAISKQPKLSDVWPPLPKWTPTFAMPIATTLPAFKQALNGPRDIVVFNNGTMVIVEQGLEQKRAVETAKTHLKNLIGFHPDMSPGWTNSGDVLIGYNQTGFTAAFNLVLASVARKHWAEIEAKHLDGLTPDEVLITPLGSNVFDDLGKMALLGRAYMFLDALDPKVVLIDRAANQ